MGTVDTVKIVAEKRDTKGTTGVRRLRRTGTMPGVVYNETGVSRPVQIDRHAFEMMMRKRRSEHVLLDMEIKDEKMIKVLVKEIQRHVVTGEPLHADFLEISMTRKMRVGIPIKLVGEPAGVTAGGTLDQQMRELSVECLPGDLVEFFTMDVSALQIGQNLTVSQLKVDPKIHVLSPASQVVALVLAPMAEEEVAVEAAAEGTEPELIKKPAKEGEEGEAEAAEGAKPAEKGKAAPAGAKAAPAEKAAAKPEAKGGKKG